MKGEGREKEEDDIDEDRNIGGDTEAGKEGEKGEGGKGKGKKWSKGGKRKRRIYICIVLPSWRLKEEKFGQIVSFLLHMSEVLRGGVEGGKNRGREEVEEKNCTWRGKREHVEGRKGESEEERRKKKRWYIVLQERKKLRGKYEKVIMRKKGEINFG